MKYLVTLLLIVVGTLSAKEIVVVSVAPYVELVRELTDGEVEVELFVPAGQSAHTYEPTPKQLVRMSKAKVWFTIGEPFEAKAQMALMAENAKLKIVQLQKGLDLIENCCQGHEGHDEHASFDPHIWMSPKLMQKQLVTMAESLKEAFSQMAPRIDERQVVLEARLRELDRQIHALLDSKRGRTIFVSHPAYGYFCREYDLTEVAIEFEGRDPTAKQLTKLLEIAKKDHVRAIFTQKQYSQKAAKVIASEIDARVVELDPYSEKYFDSMLEIAKTMAKSFSEEYTS